MPNFGEGSKLEEAGPDNILHLPVKTWITIKYNSQILSVWFDVGGKVTEVMGSNSSMV